jgi:hypothetical protein
MSETNRAGFEVKNASYWRRRFLKLEDKFLRIQSMVTTDFESKEALISRVKNILKEDH